MRSRSVFSSVVFALFLFLALITPSFAQGGSHVVRRGDSLSAIAQRYGTTVQALMSVNRLRSTVIYPGQRLVISGRRAAGVAAPRGEKWIDVNLSKQTLTAYVGNTPVYRAVVSTGTRKYPTVVGTFRVYVKLRTDRMTGGRGADYYDLPNVPYVMYFYRGYGIHGTYWHNNFGTPMSHGCVNLRTGDARWLYNWATVGTKVVTHY
jgi:lipoprotein-anchoring transpeptidase ErfK/SrfK